MSAAHDLALWVREHLPRQMGDATLVQEGLTLSKAVLAEGKPLVDRAFDMWMVMATTGEYRVGPSAKDIVRTARAMMEEVANPTPFPERKAPQGEGLATSAWTSSPEDELARY